MVGRCYGSLIEFHRTKVAFNRASISHTVQEAFKTLSVESGLRVRIYPARLTSNQERAPVITSRLAKMHSSRVWRGWGGGLADKRRKNLVNVRTREGKQARSLPRR